MPGVLIAFDKWKSCFTAAQACEVAARALSGVGADWTCDLCPLSDGGEGFGKTLTERVGGEWRLEEVSGPVGNPVTAGFGIVRWERLPPAVKDLLTGPFRESDRLGVVEMASASGLELVEVAQRDPWRTGTGGTGELLVRAAEAGAAAIMLGIGGSATNDLGLGALGHLGLEALDQAGREVSPLTPGRWEDVAGFRGNVPPDFPPIFIACDVTNPLLGPHGCAAVYGLQKGLRPEDVPLMDAGAARMARMLCDYCRQPLSLCDAPGSGAAGGMAFGLCAAAGARCISGGDLFAAWMDLDRRLAECDVVLTGEGAFDATSLMGKGPGDIVRRASALGKRVVVLAGSVDPELRLPAGVIAKAVTPAGLSLREAIASGPRLLAEAVAEAFAAYPAGAKEP
jgi:glycerate kinase